MDYLLIIVMFLSAVWTLILMAPIHCRRSIGEQVMLNFSKSDLMIKISAQIRDQSSLRKHKWSSVKRPTDLTNILVQMCEWYPILSKT